MPYDRWDPYLHYLTWETPAGRGFRALEMWLVGLRNRSLTFISLKWLHVANGYLIWPHRQWGLRKKTPWTPIVALSFVPYQHAWVCSASIRKVWLENKLLASLSPPFPFVFSKRCYLTEMINTAFQNALPRCPLLLLTHQTSLVMFNYNDILEAGGKINPIGIFWGGRGCRQLLSKVAFTLRASSQPFEITHVLAWAGFAQLWATGPPVPFSLTPSPSYLAVDLGDTLWISRRGGATGTLGFIVVHVLPEVLESSCAF